MFGGGPPIQLMWSKAFDPEKPLVQRDVQWQRIIGYFKPYAKLQTIVFICVLCNSIVSLAPAICTMRLIDRAISAEVGQFFQEFVCLFVQYRRAVAKSNTHSCPHSKNAVVVDRYENEIL